MNQIGLVVIGRNEGQRLQHCLLSAISQIKQIVYVDSGSTDGSIEFARSLKVDVVELDLSIPFTAARARNEGFARLLAVNPQIEYVQFIDGDCELVSGWLEFAENELNAKSDVAVVCGRRRERYPDKSIYNTLCDIEWDTPIGEAKGCGGDAMMRVKAFQQVGGFNPTLIAGEEPELCVRLRRMGWKIWRLNAEMTLHDAQIMHFKQWWRRTMRAGYAYAEGAWLHGNKPEHHWVKESQSILLWGLFTPLLVLSMGWFTHGLSLLLLTAYPLLGVRIFLKAYSRQISSENAARYALYCVVGKFPQTLGLLDFLKDLTLQTKSVLIEYKNSCN
ncbi:glycosyltransferase [Aetokthonos hydrillicola Thurmond2011]|jgi:glycosyltransferase involved in cell wall biosynthesis|uniref:Glycosyltransferase n=1 Tax=Aetokthonos hydrillicola Thurmond2011 TaxID=2712845 RepID=A0AAP5M8D7_9CYAN|nr:glycosyltransferase [Aetokthonos hydrillicola]MBO3462587.1 glycosyltransferase [Aetokthonos hydrillicola CCALA 1050]MBW4589579.1 glycosyltransferase [Aetokthonos hydrillicola CCALA 1050]MDR9893179.1 glycosyltransferase [Aetokthonos hydrillicola Thurmond2011]